MEYPLDDYAGLMGVIDNLETEQAEFLGMLLDRTIAPQSVVDWGCASGLYLVPFERRGCSILGLDGEPTAGRLIRKSFKRVDFRQAQYIGHFDLALCIEVAEHLQPEYADTLVENVARSAKTIFWSAAQPGASGLFHYNEQPVSYWLEKFEARGFTVIEPLNEYILGQIRENYACQKIEWLLNNSRLLGK